MVDLNNRIYLVTGQDTDQRRLAIDGIKKKVLPRSDPSFSTLIFYAKEVSVTQLQEKAFTFSFGKEKILIIKEAYNLAKETKDFFLANFKKIISQNYLIFEMDKDYAQLMRDKKITSDKLFNLFLTKAIIPLKYQKSPSNYEVSFDNFRQRARSGDVSGALYILEKLFEGKNSDEAKKALGLQILGVLVGECSYLRNPLIKQRYFDYLFEADRSIKEKGLEPRFALEILLTKLLGAELI